MRTLMLVLILFNICIKGVTQTTGDQEVMWAKQLFKENHTPQHYNRFKGKLEVVNNTTIKYDSTVVTFSVKDSALKTIFTTGLFYPGIPPANLKFLSKPKFDSLLISTAESNVSYNDSLLITNVQELPFLYTSPQVKRFSFWLFTSHLANPSVYFIELTNQKATVPATDLASFIKGSMATLFLKGWVII